jgi:SAM-dependent methyltransferase
LSISNQLTYREMGDLLATNVFQRLFPMHLGLVPQLNEVYELELAFFESQILSDEEIIRNGAYFAQVGDRLTRHFLICSGEPVRLPQHSSSRLKSFFQSNQFKTGYATHGLFPYRGKFHPQMIKGILNVMGLKPGDSVLDPMMGSGTVLIEACLMGIKSFGIDSSPFCRFMTQTKIDGLTVPTAPLKLALKNCETVFDYFKLLIGVPEQGSKINLTKFDNNIWSAMESSVDYQIQLPDDCDSPKVYNLLLLAYLDSAGYSERSNRKTHFEQFKAILERYIFVVEKIQHVFAGAEEEIAEAIPSEGDARSLPYENSCIDGIVFSPPYSFAIDYLENDSFHLGYMGVDINLLREKMVGLRGRTLRQKYDLYKSDMDKILAECSRVLKPGKLCVIVVGTNSNQLSKILGTKNVQGIDEMLIQLGKFHNLALVRKIERQITGMANTMRSEFIVILQKSKC